MKTFAISDPVAGEQLLGIEPAMAAYPDAGWRQRLNYFSGRALTHTALRTEQQGRAGHLAALGRLLSAGVVTGLEVVAATAAEGAVSIEIAAGMGLAASGETVTLNRNRQLRLDDIQLHAPAALFGDEAPAAPTGGAYRTGVTLAEARSAALPLPQALVLVLQPVAVEHVGEAPSLDPCEYDPSDEAFENWQWLDGCRALLYAWPAELGPLPSPGPWRRNRIAHTIFSHERGLSAGEHLPWAHLGVAIALVGLDASLNFDFLDRHAVVRRGGEVRGGAVPVAPAGNRLLWQAQFEQFNEQLVEWLGRDLSTPATALRAEQQFRYLPPVGVLPKEVVEPRRQRQRFFPPGYRVEALVIPYEQLDLALQESASLAPFDLNTPDRLEILVPVPQAHYEPELLVVEQIDPGFDQAIARFELERSRWLGRRLDVRGKASLLYRALAGEALSFPEPDPDAIDEAEQAGPFEPAEELFGTDDGEVVALRELRDYLDTTPLSDEERGKLETLGVEAFIDFLQRRIDAADDRVEFGFLRLRTDIYRVRQMMLGNEAGTKLATSPALAEIARGESAVATKKELNDYYQRLKQGIEVARKTGGDSSSARAEPSGDGRAGGGASARGAERVVAPLAMGSVLLFPEGDLQAESGGLAPDNLSTAKKVGVVKGGGLLRTESSSALLFRQREASPLEIGEQMPLVGKPQLFNVTVGERLEESSANISHMAGVAAKGELVQELLDVDLNLDDIRLPGVPDPGAPGGAEADIALADLKQNRDLVTNIFNGAYDPVEGNDEAAYFNAGVKALENVVATLRLVEGRVAAYRRVLARCRSTLKRLRDLLAQTKRRLETIDNELAEARHDLSVARALKAEEEERLAELNERRERVLATLVPFLLFRRPRLVDTRLDLPVCPLDPDLSQQPLPLCDLAEVEPPEALEAMMGVVRDAPLRWFAVAAEVLPRLSRPADLNTTLAGAKKRALGRESLHPFFNLNFDLPDKLLQGIGGVLKRSRRRMVAERKRTAAIDLVEFQRFGWRESLERVGRVVSLGDVIDGAHGRTGASRRVAGELADIAEVVTCLYRRFSEVAPSIRLDWAERLSQFDDAVSLRNLHTLPRFGELDYRERHALQALADWLYSRVVLQEREAAGLASDLIRVALLLASQSPVNRLIAGYVAEPARVEVGSQVRIAVDLSRVRIGMAVSFAAAGATVARGRVADIAAGQVVAEIASLGGSRQLELAAGSRVQIGERLGMTMNLLR